jgi:hypothetical protein
MKWPMSTCCQTSKVRRAAPPKLAAIAGSGSGPPRGARWEFSARCGNDVSSQVTQSHLCATLSRASTPRSPIQGAKTSILLFPVRH